MASGGCRIKRSGICTEGEVRLWDVKTGNLLDHPLRFQVSKSIYELAFSPDNNILAVASCAELDKDQPSGICTKGEIRLWDVLNGQLIGQPLLIQAGEVNDLAFSSDGTILASGSYDNIILWDVASGWTIGQPLLGSVESLAFSPDSKTLASASSAITLWDVASGQTIGLPLADNMKIVYSLTLSPDGKILASGDNSGKIILWDIDPVSWKTRTCHIANRNLTREEWKQYLGDEPYRATCPNLPVPEEAQP